MRLTLKLTIALIAGMVAALAVNAWLRLERETLLFEAGMRRHAHVFGHALGHDVSWAWQRAGEAAALDLVTQANEKDSELDVRWVWLEPQAAEAFRPRLPLAALESVRRGQELAVRLPAAKGPGDLYTYVPVALPDGRLGALQIAESLRAQQEFIRTVQWNALLALLTLIVVTALLATALGFFFVGRPTRVLVRKANRIGAGDLDQPVVLRQRDELGDIAAGMNAMCEQLAVARDRVSVETAARLAAMDQLRHADRLMTVGKLASGIAHELGTPLNVVAGRAQMIASGEALGDEIVHSARIVVEQSKRMTQIIRQLLDFARPRRSQKARVEMSVLAAATVNLLDSMARKRGVSIAIEPGEYRPAANVDEGQIQQALTNLVVNAIQACSSGGQVTVGLNQEVAQAPADRGGGMIACLRLFVRDTGQGMNLETQTRVFEPFFTTKEVGEGTGLGLSVTHGIVTEHGGWIGIESSPGKGSTFSIYLPLESPA